jgi:hypothetical protein
MLTETETRNGASEGWIERSDTSGDSTMRAATVLIGFLMFTGSALAADTQDKQAAAKKIVVAAADLKQVQAAPAIAAKVAVSRRAPVANEGDSRLNDYRLERDSCCGPQ